MKKFFFIFFFLSSCLPPFSAQSSTSFETGKELFSTNCITCHAQGKNIIIPEKNLKKEALETNGMNTMSAISYQVMNGKNGMPAFGGRLTEKEINQIAMYILQESTTSFLEEESLEMEN